MSIYIDSLSTIERKLGIQDNGPAQAFMTETCYKAMDKYVPQRDGNLRTIVSMTSNSITYESDYASYQYYGEREDGTHKVKNYTTPGTGPYWDKRMISADMKSVVKQVQNYINGGKQ